jgi:hypothetical protein
MFSVLAPVASVAPLAIVTVLELPPRLVALPSVQTVPLPLIVSAPYVGLKAVPDLILKPIAS